ncbi:acyl-CoA dehydrogenase family protein [Kitasatospora sp. McL0602]|uniref:acyl-CoA dehydrogenase family protein n=1 Tax=Kitasatospora sp. McL0602 TaxID=3439530 RepID=UPI003F89CDA6
MTPTPKPSPRSPRSPRSPASAVPDASAMPDGPAAPVPALDHLRHGTCPPALRHRLAAVLANRPFPAEPDALTRDHRDHRALRRLAEHLPPAGEVFADTDLLAALSAATALADPSLYQSFLSHYILCVGSVVTLGGHGTDLPPASAELAHAHAKGVFMVTEIGDASSHLGTRTTATFDPADGGFVLHTPDERASKFSSIGAQGLPQKAVALARLITGGADHGVFSFLVDITDERGRPAQGVAISSPVAVDAVPLPYAVVRFDQVRLARSAWLGDSARIDADGSFHDPLGSHEARLQRTLSVGQTLWATLPSAMAAVASRSAVLTWRYCAQRRSHGRLAPGRSVLAYRTQQHAVLGALAEAFALTCAAAEARRTWHAARLRTDAARQGPTEMAFSPWAAVDRPLAVHKALSTRATADLLAECQHRCGVAGFYRLHRLQAYHGLAHAFDNAGGDNTLILLDAGRGLATDKPSEPPALLPGVAPTDPAWWPLMAQALQHRLTQELRAALDERSQAATTGLDLWNPLLAQTLELGESYAHRLAADSVTETLKGITDPQLQQALRTLAALHGLVQARRHAGLLLRTGLLDPAAVRRLPTHLDSLCDALGPDLPMLADALDPDTGHNPTPMDAPDYARALTSTLTWRRGPG